MYFVANPKYSSSGEVSKLAGKHESLQNDLSI